MADWCNVRLIAVGARVQVLRFARVCRVRSSSVFKPDMLRGEGQALSSERATGLGDGQLEKIYTFQVRNDDGLNHFRSVSRQYPDLRFILVYEASHCDEYGSYLLARGRARTYRIPDRQKEEVMVRHGITEDFVMDSDDKYFRYTEVWWELMDLAEAHWNSLVGRATAP
jgi:hypothetical protein